jgi:hypothetical protein
VVIVTPAVFEGRFRHLQADVISAAANARSAGGAGLDTGCTSRLANPVNA